VFDDVTLYDDVTLCMMMCHRYDLHLQHVFDDVTLYDDVTLCMMIPMTYISNMCLMM